MKILVSGSTGLVGKALVSSLTGAGHQVTRLVRSRSGAGEKDIYWDPVDRQPGLQPARRS